MRSHMLSPVTQVVALTQKVTFILPKGHLHPSFLAIWKEATKTSPEVFYFRADRSASLASTNHRCATARAGNVQGKGWGAFVIAVIINTFSGHHNWELNHLPHPFWREAGGGIWVSILFREESYALWPRTVLTWTSVFNQLKQFGVDGLISLPKHRDEVIYLLNIVRSKECVCCACFGTAGSSSNSVDIVLWGVRVVIIDDKFHIFHICKVLQCGKKQGTKFCTPQQPNRR